MSRVISALATPRFLISGSLLLIVSVAAATFHGFPAEYQLTPGKISLEGDYAYTTPLELAWQFSVVSDDSQTQKASHTKLFEDGRPLGPAHTAHAHIRSVGYGRYSHWQGRLYFSTSDNSDPRTNGRRYHAVLRVRLASEVLLSLLLALGLAIVGIAVRWLRAGRIGLRDLAVPASLWIGGGMASAIAGRVEGVSFWLLLAIDAGLMVWAVATVYRTYVRGSGRRWTGFGRAKNATLAAVSLGVALAGAEAFLLARERLALEPEAVRPVEPAAAGTADDAAAREPAATEMPVKPATNVPVAEPPAAVPAAEAVAAAPQTEAEASTPIERALESFGLSVPREVLQMAARRAALVTLPPDFAREPVEVEGAVRASKWHGVVHVYDRQNMRRTTPFPARPEDVFRVMVVGDSLTYGDGIDEQWTYSRQLEALLEPDFEVEVLNLGVDGSQSEDIVGIVREHLPRLSPDLVVYGVCLNDFLPSGVGQYANNHAYEFPLPDAVKTFFTSRSRLARLIEDTYDQVLLRLGFRVDFYGDILNGFTGYQARFAQDVSRLNQMVRAQGLPPVVALTLDQAPRLGSRGYLIAQAAESHLKSAGMDVIDSAPYYSQFDGLSLRVSRWEGHPNEIANAIWAVMLGRHIRDLPELQAFRRSEG